MSDPNIWNLTVGLGGNKDKDSDEIMVCVSMEGHHVLLNPTAARHMAEQIVYWAGYVDRLNAQAYKE